MTDRSSPGRGAKAREMRSIAALLWRSLYSLVIVASGTSSLLCQMIRGEMDDLPPSDQP